MKSLSEQIKFLDEIFLPAYGIKSIIDYVSVVGKDNLIENLPKINNTIPELRKYFVANKFSLHKTDYKILTSNQAYFVLKMCLQTSAVPFEHPRLNALRLNKKNFVLDNYIKQKLDKMMDIHENPNDNVVTQKIEDSTVHPSTENDNSSDFLNLLDNCEDNKNIKSRSMKYYYFEPRHKTKVKKENFYGYELKLEKKNFSKIRIKPVVKNYGSEEKIEDSMRKECTVCTIIGGNVVDECAWEKDKNVLLTKNYIMPAKLSLTYMDFSIGIDVSEELTRYVEFFQVEVESVEFYAQTSNRLSDCKKGFEIPIDNNILRFVSGMACVAYTENVKNTLKSIKKDVDLSGRIVDWGNYIKLIKLLKYDKVLVDDEMISLKKSEELKDGKFQVECRKYANKVKDVARNFSEKNGVYSIKFNLCPFADTIGGIYLRNLNFDTDTLKLVIVDADKPDILYPVNEIKDFHHIKRRPSFFSHLYLLIQTENKEHIIDVWNNGIVNQDVYFYNLDYLKKIRELDYNFIHILYDVFNGTKFIKHDDASREKLRLVVQDDDDEPVVYYSGNLYTTVNQKDYLRRIWCLEGILKALNGGLRRLAPYHPRTGEKTTYETCLDFPGALKTKITYHPKKEKQEEKDE